MDFIFSNITLQTLFQGPILPGQHSIERYLIEEQLKHILQANHVERKDW